MSLDPDDPDFFDTYMRTNSSTCSEDFEDFLAKVDFNSSSYFQFSKFDILRYLNCYNGLPCVCGSLLTSLNVTNLDTKPNIHVKSSSSKAKLIEKFNISEEVSNQVVNLVEQKQQDGLPKIHSMRSFDKFSSLKSSMTNSDSTEPMANQSQKKQTFVYYVDPRVSINFVSIFNSLKRKLLNKGFQY